MTKKIQNYKENRLSSAHTESIRNDMMNWPDSAWIAFYKKDNTKKYHFFASYNHRGLSVCEERTDDGQKRYKIEKSDGSWYIRKNLE